MKLSTAMRMECAIAIGGISELVQENDSFLAKLVDTHRANMSTFTRRDRVEAVSVKAIVTLLKRYGLEIRDDGLAPGPSEACPVIRIENADSDADLLQALVALMSRAGERPRLNKLYGVDVSGFIMHWQCKESRWIALGSPTAAEGNVIDHLVSWGCIESESIDIDAELMDLWMLCGPRKSEVALLLKHLYGSSHSGS